MKRKKIGENGIDNKVLKVSGKVFFIFSLYFSTPMLFICCTKILPCKCLCCSIFFIFSSTHTFLFLLFILTKCEVEKKNCYSYFCCFRIISHDTLTVCDVMTESCFFTYFPHSQLWKKKMNEFFSCCTSSENKCDNNFILGLKID